MKIAIALLLSFNFMRSLFDKETIGIIFGDRFLTKKAIVLIFNNIALYDMYLTLDYNIFIKNDGKNFSRIHLS